MADLHHLGRAQGRRRAAALLDRFDLADAATKTAATYSGGMRRRLDRLDAESIEVDELSVHTPDLDDVFLALTGHSDKEKEPVR
jgi:ABC-type taurine transport system ATPase subunit